MGKRPTPEHLRPVELHVKLPRELNDILLKYLEKNKSLNKTEVVINALILYLNRNVEK